MRRAVCRRLFASLLAALILATAALSPPGRPAGAAAPLAPSRSVLGGYRTVEETYALLDGWQAAYPHLAEVVTYGESWDKRTPGGSAGSDLRAITLTNRARPGPKPTFVLLAAMHPREMVTTEIALRFVEYLLKGHGTDPDATWLLDDHRIVVFPVVNPDGRQDAEAGIPRRKNKNVIDAPCPVTPATTDAQPGVDLNRNFGFRWGTVNLPSDPTCGETYPGPRADSEPEVTALESRLLDLFAARRGPTDRDAAPETTAGLVISLHAFGNWVLWPWGWTADPTPNGVDLAGLGHKLATYNGYEPLKITDVTLGSGSTDDWVYGTLGVPFYTFEIGDGFGECGDFAPPFDCLDGGPGGGFWPLNQPALLYAARVARAPYLLHRGPDAIAVTSAQTEDGGLTINATIDSTRNGRRPIAAAELYLDTPPWRDGTPITLDPADGRFDGAVEAVTARIGPTDPVGRMFYVRGRDSVGNWGPVGAAWLATHNYYLPVVGRG